MPIENPSWRTAFRISLMMCNVCIYLQQKHIAYEQELRGQISESESVASTPKPSLKREAT